MYNIIKGVISVGGYKLADVQHKIKKLYMLGDLTEAQTDELLTLTTGGVSPEAERPETLEMLKALSDKIDALDNRIKALEGVEDEPSADYPEWKQWDGISQDYKMGAIVSYNGELWESIFNGQNVWQPGAVGTESMWVKYTKE